MVGDFFRRALTRGKTKTGSTVGWELQLTLGLKLRLQKPDDMSNFDETFREKSVNGSPILTMLFHSKAFGQCTTSTPRTETNTSFKTCVEKHSPETKPSPASHHDRDDEEEEEEEEARYEADERLIDEFNGHVDQQHTVDNPIINFSVDSEDPIPPEYKTAYEHFQGRSLQVSVDHVSETIDQTSQIHTSQSHPLPSLLTEEAVSLYNERYLAERIIPQGPYHFMLDPNHPAPDYMTRDSDNLQPIHCVDGCPDCDLLVYRVMRSRQLVHLWFESYFPLELAQIIRNDNPSHTKLAYRQITDGPETNNQTYEEDAADYLLGATDSDDFPYFKTLKKPVDDNYACGDLNRNMTINMMRGEMAHSEIFSYYWGLDYIAIVSEYEPRFLPRMGIVKGKIGIDYQYCGIEVGDTPIWEGRGGVTPVQGDWNLFWTYT